jgi:homoserine acetyltransferase
MVAPPALAELTVDDLKPDYADAEVGVATALRLHGDDQITQKAMYFKANLEDNWDGGYYKAKGRVRYDAGQIPLRRRLAAFVLGPVGGRRRGDCRLAASGLGPCR